MQIEIQQIETAIIVLAKAIEEGRITDVVEDVKTIMGYLPQ